MIEILPNWHPALVHFPIALTMAAALFITAARFAGDRPIATQWIAAGRWMLRLGAVSALLAALAGWFAFNSVDHDDAGHVAMLLHRNWALATVAAIVLLAAWEILCARAGRPLSWPFVGALCLAAAGVGTTGWLGGELVYRHRLGVMAPTATVVPPQNAEAAAVPPHDQETAPSFASKPARKHDHSGHAH